MKEKWSFDEVFQRIEKLKELKGSVNSHFYTEKDFYIADDGISVYPKLNFDENPFNYFH